MQGDTFSINIYTHAHKLVQRGYVVYWCSLTNDFNPLSIGTDLHLKASFTSAHTSSRVHSVVIVFFAMLAGFYRIQRYSCLYSCLSSRVQTSIGDIKGMKL